MPIKDILIEACPKDNIAPLFAWAAHLNARLEARLSCVSYAWPRTADFVQSAILNPLVTSELEQRMETELATVRRIGEKALQSPDLDWCSGVGQPDEALIDHLYTADLLVTIAQTSAHCVTPDPIDLAVRSGTPVLRLKSDIKPSDIDVAVVAWKDCAAARRALHSARALLVLAREIHVVGVGDEVSGRRLDEIADFLRRSDLPVKPIHLPDPKGRPGDVIVDHAFAAGANIVVSGARSERSLRDRLFGNATRQFTECPEFSWYISG